MFREEKLEKVNLVLKSLSEIPEFTSLLVAMNSAEREIEARISAMASPNGKPDGEGANIARILATLPSAVREKNPRVILKEVDYLHTALGLGLSFAEPNQPYSWITVDLDRVADAYGSFVTNQNPANGYAFLRLASSLKVKLGMLRLNLEFIRDAILNSPKLGNDEEALTITFYSTVSATALASRIEAIGILYSEFARIKDVSTLDFPPRLTLVEAGSARVTIFGKSQIIRMVTDFLRNIAGYLYRNHTKEGQLREIPAKAESIKAILDLAKELRDRGLPADQVEEEATQASVSLAKQTNRILGGETRVTLNGMKLDLLSGGQDVKQLEHGVEPRHLPPPGPEDE